MTGSSGRVGSAIAAGLAGDNEVLGLDLSPGQYTTHVGPIEDATVVAKAIRGADAVVHTASLHAPHVGLESPARFRRVNVEGTRVLLDAALGAGVRRIVYTSSTSVYGRALQPAGVAVWVTEDLEPVPRDIYDETKLEAESLLRNASGTGRLSCTCLRMSRCFPEAENLVATYRLYRGVDLRDVVTAHRLALARDGQSFEVFNISARSPFLQQDCAELLVDATSLLRRRIQGMEAAYVARGWPMPASIDRVYVIEKAERLLRYAPQFNFSGILAALNAGPAEHADST